MRAPLLRSQSALSGLAALTALIGCLLIAGASTPAQAQTGEMNYSTCSGHHCVIVGHWYAGNSGLGALLPMLSANLNIDTILSGPAAPVCPAGSQLDVSIASSGELTGTATAYYDTPPITFNDGGTLTGITDGILLRACQSNAPGTPCTETNLRNTMINQGISAADVDKALAQLTAPLNGGWTDEWQTTSGAITCQTTGAASGTCSLTSGVTGPVTITLKRSVNYVQWQNVIEGSGAFGIFGSGNPFPATMTSSVTLNCPESSSPNLTVTQPKLTPPAPAAGEPLAFEAVVVSNGQVAPNPTTATARLDIGADGTYDETFTPDRSVAGLGASGTLPVGWFDAWTAQAGTHRYEICVDPQNAVAESDETDNCLTRTFTVVAGPGGASPDLTAADVSVTGTLAVGQPATLTARLMNVGTADAPASVTAARQSGDDVATAPTNPLARSAFQYMSLTWTPTIPGTQRIYVCADAADTIPESNEDNNCGFRDVTVTVAPQPEGPDLAVSPLSFPGTYQVGQPGQVTAFVVNIGRSDVTVPTTAARIGASSSTASVNPLRAGHFQFVTLTWTPVATGLQTVTVCADAGGVVPEANENNNCTSSQVNVGPGSGSSDPDLAIAGLSVPGPYTVGQPGTIDAIIVNVSPVSDAGASSAITEANNTEIAQTAVRALPHGHYEHISVPWTPTESGWQLVVVCADSTNVVTEANEQNNCAYRQVIVGDGGGEPEPGPDLTIVRISGISATTVGESGFIDAIVANISPDTDVAASTAIVEANNTEVGRPTVPDLAHGHWHYLSTPWTPTESGWQLVVVCADGTNAITETNEGNNCAFRQVVIGDGTPPSGPDLAAIDVGTTTPPIVNQPTEVRARIVNATAGTPASASVASAATDDTAIGTASVAAFTQSGWRDVVIPWTPTATGSQPLTVCADATNQVTEVNETNNCDTVTVTVGSNGGAPGGSVQPGPIRETE